MSSVKDRRSPLSFVLLALLAEQPMHVYGLHKLMLERGHDTLVNIEQRNSVQQVLDRLRRDGHVEVVPSGDTSRRVVYRTTDAGRDLLFDWLRHSVAQPRREYPSFPVAVSLIAFLPPGEARALLAERRAAIGHEIDSLVAAQRAGEALPSVLTLELDLALHLNRAEAQWLDRTIDRLATGTLAWHPDDLLRESRERPA